MESEGADHIFRLSVATHKLQYTDLYVDSDSKSYNQVKDVYSATTLMHILSRKNVFDMYKKGLAHHSRSWRKKLLVLEEKENLPMPSLINFRAIMALLLL